MALQPVLFLSHGGGPLPLLNAPNHQDMLRAYRSIADEISRLPRKPSALVFISAHWETNKATVTAHADPGLLYDYYGFPEQAYQLTYPVSGAPTLAQTITDHLTNQKIDAVLDTQRALDHGVFVPALLLFPQADIPCLQISLHQSLEPDYHLRLGRALAFLREQNVLLIGSGYSFHNMQAFFKSTENDDAQNTEFENWLDDTLQLADNAEREKRLKNWSAAPHARYCHPREEHLMPLHVCAGAAGKAISRRWQFTALDKLGSCYWWD